MQLSGRGLVYKALGSIPSCGGWCVARQSWGDLVSQTMYWKTLVPDVPWRFSVSVSVSHCPAWTHDLSSVDFFFFFFNVPAKKFSK
jgi:hypothetical protein